MNILDQIAAKTRERVELLKQMKPLEKVKKEAELLPKGEFIFEKKLSADGISFICEVKKASPSKGIIAESFPYVEIAEEYEAAGAAAISVLTEPHWFLGADNYLTEISRAVNIPVLRKDFTIDKYQIYEAKAMGAAAALLICALLDEKSLAEYIAVADQLGLSALVEAHDEKEVKFALSAGARIIGVNNRNLKTFEVDLENCVKLRGLVPDNVLFVAESGIKTRADIERLSGVDAVLIGETLMRSADKKLELDKLRALP